MHLNRGRCLATALALCAVAACNTQPTQVTGLRSPLLSARVHAPASTIAPGEHELPAEVATQVTLYVPTRYDASRASGLIIMLHGAGQSRNLMHNLYPSADSAGVILLVPKSRGRTWDLLQFGFGADVEIIDRALAYAFEHCNIDPRKIAIGGFSDGASYALSLGLPNGELFTWIAAFSPGFMQADTTRGRPSIYVAHGVDDEILNVSASRQIVSQLRARGYDVLYREFDGPHTIRQIDFEEALAKLR